MALKLEIESEPCVDLNRRDEYVRGMWNNLYADYISYMEVPHVRSAINHKLQNVNPDDLLGNWLFVLFTTANNDFRAGVRKNEHDFVTTLQTAGVVAYDKHREEDVYLQAA